jgi:hypothetical protein
MKMLPNFYLFVDEFQNFANASFADILSEARKYKLNLTIAHQYIEQMDEVVRPAVFGNVGTMIAFRVGAHDAEALEQEFSPVFTIEDLVNLGFAQIYLKLMIDGLSSAPFSATTLGPIPHPDQSFLKDIIQSSREQFTRPRAEVEEAIVKFHDSTPTKTTASKAAAAPVAPPLPASPKPLPTPAPVPTPSPTPVPAAPQKPAPLIKAVTPPVEKPHITPAPLNPKPVSLSSLNKAPMKQDPKQRSPENVNDLKNALAAVLGKAKSEAAQAVPTPNIEKKETPKKVEPKVTVKKEQPKAAPAPEVTTPAPPRAGHADNEIPRDILEKVLKID